MVVFFVIERTTYVSRRQLLTSTSDVTCLLWIKIVSNSPRLAAHGAGGYASSRREMGGCVSAHPSDFAHTVAQLAGSRGPGVPLPAYIFEIEKAAEPAKIF